MHLKFNVEISKKMKDQKNENALKHNENKDLGMAVSNAEQFVEKNVKWILIGVGVVILAVLAYVFLIKPALLNRERNAAADNFKAEYWFGQGDYELALNGSDSLDFIGFAELATTNKGTKACNLAKYYAGICCLNLGKYDEALDYFNSYKGKDEFTKPLNEMLKGDAEWELKNESAALKHYEKAAKMCKDNFVVAPTALYKAGRVCLAIGNNEKALTYFKQIKTDYPESTEWTTIDRYIALAEAGQE